MPKLLVIKQYIEPKNTINLGLIRDVVNPMTTEPKQEVALLAKALRNMDASTVDAKFTEDTPVAWGDLRPSLHADYSTISIHVHIIFDSLCQRLCRITL